MNSVAVGLEGQLAQRQQGLHAEDRSTSVACSDCVNNSRSMTDAAEAHYDDASRGKKGVETWLQHDVERPEHPIATGSPGDVSDDGMESPKHHGEALDNSVHTPTHDRSPVTFPELDEEGGVGAEGDMYEQQLMEEAKKMEEAAAKKKYRFSMNDIFNNPALEDAAKQEMQERPVVTPTLSTADSVISLPESRVSHLEQTLSTTENLDRDADRDLQAGHVEISSLQDRLNIGKSSLMHLLKFVQKLYQSETAYSRALLAVSRMSVSNVGHTDGFRYASECLCELPMTVRSAHSKIAESLAECESSLNNVIRKIKEVSDEFASEAPKLTAAMRSKRSALSRSKTRHQVAYKRMESIQEVGSGAGRNVDDPWLTEGEVARDYTQLIGTQVSVKKALASAYERATEVELLRLRTSKSVISSIVHLYGSSIQECVAPFAADISKALMVLEEEEEVTDLRKSARNSTASEQVLRQQCEDQENVKFGELFTSPDIIRQGPLQVLDEESRSWVNAHFVLTKAGLYWYTDEGSRQRPDDSLMLARTSIEQAKAPGLKLVQEGTSYFSWRRAVILRANSVDEYCEWAIALREAIQEIQGGRK